MTGNVWGAYDGWGEGHPSPYLFPLDALGVSILAKTSVVSPQHKFLARPIESKINIAELFVS